MYRTSHRNMLLYFNVILDASCKYSTRRNDIQMLYRNIVAYFDEASSQLSDASAQLRDASKMQLWLTINVAARCRYVVCLLGNEMHSLCFITL